MMWYQLERIKNNEWLIIYRYVISFYNVVVRYDLFRMLVSEFRFGGRVMEMTLLEVHFQQNKYYISGII